MSIPRTALLPIFCGLLAAQEPSSITLDPKAMDEVWRQVAGSNPTAGASVSPEVRTPDAASLPPAPAALWQEPAEAVDSSTFPVLVLSLMQMLNPQLPMEKNVWAYAAALELHRQAFTGNARARAEMAAALRCGRISGLNYFTDAALADELQPRVEPPPAVAE